MVISTMRVHLGKFGGRWSIDEGKKKSDCIISVKADHQQCQLLASGRGNSRGRELPTTVSAVAGIFTKQGRAPLEVSFWLYFHDPID